MEKMNVLIEGAHTGALQQDDSGSLSFRYVEGYSGIPLSLAMPVRNQAYGDKQVRPFLFGLLPDSEEVRKSLASEFDVSPRNPFALLRHVGLDCPGAVQICDDESLALIKAREEILAPISDHDIAERLREVRREGSKWVTDLEHWSLGGQQSKFALRRENDKWFSAEGAAATTHILKPGIQGLTLQALNEFLCLKVASACGINTAKCDYRLFEDQPAIVVERYDRIKLQGVVKRVHQEDFCQMLGCLPEHKYSEEGGPSAADVIRMLKQTGEDAPDNIRSFVEMLLFNYLIAAPDAHAKNYSVLLGESRAIMAPLYDVASILPYKNEVTDIRLAMGIAGENRTGRLSGTRIAKFVDSNGLEGYGLTAGEVASILLGLASQIPEAACAVAKEYAHIPGVKELSGRIVPKLEELCRISVERVKL